MALPELAVMQQTFELLHQLDPQARRRVLKWVKAALDEAEPAADPAVVPAPAEQIDAGVRQVTTPEPGDPSVIDESAADIAGDPASADEGEALTVDRDGTTTPSSSPAPAVARPARRAAKPTRGRATAKTADRGPTEQIDAGGPQATAPEPGDTSVIDESAADIAGDPASADEGEASSEGQDEATTPPVPAVARPARRAAKTAAKSTRGRAKAKTADPAVEAPAAAVAGRRGRPPADEIMRVYQQVDGKLTELAKHYGKPYGTIQGWASTLREQGYPIGRSRKS